MKKIKIISLGGSLINPGKIDIEYLKNFKKFIDKFIKKDFKFLIVCGGGAPAREYQNALKNFKKDKNFLDWIGIYATYINAKLLQLIFEPYSNKNIISTLKRKLILKKSITIASGTKPGFSTDYDAFYFSNILKTKEVINLTNIDYIYKIEKNKKINLKNITWKEYLDILKLQNSQKWSPGMNLPVDPVAGKFGLKNNIKCIVCNGKDFDNLYKILIGNLNFKGTKINGD